MNSIEEVENSIREIYLFFAKEAPGVTPREEGRLGDLWELFDKMVN